MDAAEEDLLVAQVVDRLSEHFPDTSRLRIAEVVDDEHHRLDGNPIRDFIPVLVEHAARVRLRADGETAPPIAPPEFAASNRAEAYPIDVPNASPSR